MENYSYQIYCQEKYISVLGKYNFFRHLLIDLESIYFPPLLGLLLLLDYTYLDSIIHFDTGPDTRSLSF